MKKKDKNLLMLAALGAGGYFLYTKSKESSEPSTAGFPGASVGAMLPNHSLVPASMRGQCSPWWMDVGVWGLAGTALGYYGLAGKKF